MPDPQNSDSESAESFGLEDVKSELLSFSSDRYRIERRLGSGGMAHVLLATDTVLDRKVAVKVPHRKSAEQNKNTEKRFLREAQAAAGLSHPNICPIYDVGVTDGACFIAMGFIEGCLLSQVIHETEQFEEAEVAQVIRKIASGAAEAHRQGILHRDLKPANVMIDRRGEPIILDFGLARFLSDPEMDQTLTQNGQTLGTPAYMSPEQASGNRDLTPASDIFSLGVVMWEMLCGERPFAGSTLVMMGQIVHGTAPSPRVNRPGLSHDMEAICLKALAKVPEDRFESMQQFELALEDVSNGREVSIDLSKNTSNKQSHNTVDLRQASPAVSLNDEDTRVERSAISNAIRHPLFWVWTAVGLLFAIVLFVLVQNRFGPPQQDTRRPDPERGESGPSHRRPPPPGMSAEDVFAEYDRNGDGLLDPGEFPKHVIHRADESDDEQLDLQELSNGLLKNPDLYRPPATPGEYLDGRRPTEGGRPGNRPPPPGGPEGDRRPPPEGPRRPGGPGRPGPRSDRPPPR